jgi:hypothetical protein
MGVSIVQVLVDAGLDIYELFGSTARNANENNLSLRILPATDTITVGESSFSPNVGIIYKTMHCSDL